MARPREQRQTRRAPLFKVERVIGEFWRDSSRLVIGRLVLVGGTRCGDLRNFVGDGSKAQSGGLCLSHDHLVELRALVDQLIEATADSAQNST